MKIGIFGGTFDPIHRGHIEAARQILEKGFVGRIIFMPVGDPPHKAVRNIVPGEIRLAMAEAAVRDSGEANFTVSDMELKREGYTYTVDTVRQLIEEDKKEGKENEYYWIVGSDAVGELENWHESGELFKICGFIVTLRPGFFNGFSEKINSVCKKGAKIVTAHIHCLNISSTRIREEFYTDDEAASMVSTGVAQIIRSNYLYMSEKQEWTFEDIVSDIEKRLSYRRFNHSKGVMEESVRIGSMCDSAFDERRYALAGILHDCAREFSHGQYLWSGLDIDEILKERPLSGLNELLLHGPAGAIVARKKYGVEDEGILNAIAFHTTGKPGMDVLAQTVFVADYTEKGRNGAFFDTVREITGKMTPVKPGLKPAEAEKIRAANRIILLDAVQQECRNTVSYRTTKDFNVTLCVDTVETMNWAVREALDSKPVLR